jgi:hypothetical protein
MKETITFRFNNFKDKQIGATVTLSKTVRGMKYGRQKVIDAFNKFVPKGEYAQDEKEDVLNWLLVQNQSEESPEKTLINKVVKNED